MAKLRWSVYPLTMRGLEELATGVLGISLLPFLAAWDIPGEAGRKYRETVKKFARYMIKPYYVVKAVLLLLAWMGSGLLVRLIAPLDPRPGILPGPQHPDNYKGARAYLFRRKYQGRHYSGRGVWETLHAVAA